MDHNADKRYKNELMTDARQADNEEYNGEQRYYTKEDISTKVLEQYINQQKQLPRCE